MRYLAKRLVGITNKIEDDINEVSNRWEVLDVDFKAVEIKVLATFPDEPIRIRFEYQQDTECYEMFWIIQRSNQGLLRHSPELPFAWGYGYVTFEDESGKVSPVDYFAEIACERIQAGIDYINRNDMSPPVNPQRYAETIAEVVAHARGLGWIT